MFFLEDLPNGLVGESEFLAEDEVQSHDRHGAYELVKLAPDKPVTLDSGRFHGKKSQLICVTDRPSLSAISRNWTDNDSITPR